MTDRPPPELDLGLLHGFRYACRPDCGLCCYTEPRIDAPERVRLLQIAPQARVVGRGRDQFLAARPDGGACQFLSAHRCTVHAVRPHPCREFPVTVHLGHRLQATVVLSCPGIDLTHLATAGAEDDPSPAFDLEVSSIRSRLAPTTVGRLAATSRRGRKIERALRSEGRWQDDEEVRDTLRTRIPRPGPAEFPVEDPPSATDGLERLPLYFDGRRGPVALAQGLGGWELLQLDATGGAESVGMVPSPERAPALEPAADRLLEAYLRYVLQRDAFLAAVHLDVMEAEEGSVLEWTGQELRALGAVALARAVVRAKQRGRGERTLTEHDVADGIRATDMDWLDRPTWGDRL